MFNLKVSLAQREIEKTSERIKFVFNNKREKGEITTGVKKYGYNIVNKKYVVNEEEAENIRNLYKYFISVNGNVKETYSSYFIKHFDGKGMDALSNYLKETAYIGKYKLYRKDVYLDNYIPAIMDIDLWNRVQSLRKKKTVSRKQTIDDIFSGLLFCKECGLRLCKKTDNRCKNVIIRYICDNSYRFKYGTNEKKCNNTTSIREKNIEDYLLENIKEEAQHFILKYKTQNKPKKVSDNTQKINTLKHKLDKLKELFINDLIDIDTYQKDYSKYKDKLTKLSNIDPVEPIKDITNLEQLLNLDIIGIYSKLNVSEKKHFWLSLIDKIYVENGEIKEITFL